MPNMSNKEFVVISNGENAFDLNNSVLQPTEPFRREVHPAGIGDPWLCSFPGVHETEALLFLFFFWLNFGVRLQVFKDVKVVCCNDLGGQDQSPREKMCTKTI